MWPRTAMAFVRSHGRATTTQRRIVERLRMLPARRSAQQDPLFDTDPTLRASLAAAQKRPADAGRHGAAGRVGRDAAAVSGADGGAIDARARPPSNAARCRRRRSIRCTATWRPARSLRYRAMARRGLLLAVWLDLAAAQLRRSSCAIGAAIASPTCSCCPPSLSSFAVIVFPFFYNIVLSLSNMSLSNFQDWQVVGLQNYVEVFTDPTPNSGTSSPRRLSGPSSTSCFTSALGLLLAVALNGPVCGKSLYRILLIIPWAVPAYITALTWRGMFDYEYGAVNLISGSKWRSFRPPPGCSGLLNLRRPSTGSATWRTPSGLHRGQRLARLPVHDGDRAGRHAGHSARALRSGPHRSRVALAAVPPHHAAAPEARAAAGGDARHDLDVQQPERDLARLQRRRAAGQDAHPRLLRL